MKTITMRLGAGVFGGIAGLLAMSAAKRLIAPIVRERAPKPTDVFATEKTISPLGRHHREDESATDALGRIAYQKVVGHEPTATQKKALSWAVHIGYGLLVAAAYGAIEARDRGTIGRALGTGAAFGAGLWLIGDELVVPLLGLQDKPTAYSATRHVQSLAAHLGFGVATGATTHLIRSL